MQHDFIIFSGSANPALAAAVAQALKVPLGPAEIERFPDGEISVRLNESVRGREVFIVQSTSPPVNDHLIELLAFADACRRSVAARIIAVVPYFGYARGDKRHGRREPIMASLTARLMEAAGIQHIITVDMHAPQIEGFFRVPVDGLSAVGTLCHALTDYLLPETLVVSPDAGRLKTATEYAQRLGTSVVVLHKQRESGSQTKVLRLVGEVRDRNCLIIDDMISTGGTIAKSIEALLAAGARPEITIATTHGLFLKDSFNRLAQKNVRRIFVTDTIAISEKVWPQLEIVSVAPLVAAAIRQTTINGSFSQL